MKKILYSIAVVAITAAFAACSSNTVSIDGILMEESAIVRVGSTYILEVTLTPEAPNAVINWTSSNKEVATVQDGIVTGVAKGSAFITANVGNAVATCQVSVRPAMHELTIEQLAADADSISFKITPSIEKGAYLLGIFTKEVLEQHDDAEIINSLYNNAQNVAKQYNATLADLVNAYGYIGERVWYSNKLSANTEYVCVTVPVITEEGYEEAGNVLYKSETKTLPAPTSSMTFEVKIDADTLFVIPSVNDEKYSVQVVRDSIFQKNYNGDAKAYMDAAKEYYTKNYASQGGFYYTTHTGVSRYNAKSLFIDGVDYQVLMVGYKGDYTTQVFTEKVVYHAPAEEEGGEDEDKEINEVAAKIGKYNMPKAQSLIDLSFNVQAAQ